MDELVEFGVSWIRPHVLMLAVILMTWPKRSVTRVVTSSVWRFSVRGAGAAKAPAMRAGRAKRENFMVIVRGMGSEWLWGGRVLAKSDWGKREAKKRM
jgi:hypothetical protein